MQNDYMFRAVLQKSRPALKSLLCALLHLDEAEIVSVEIMNPIELGETIDGKTCMLDVKVELNKNKVINIELQIQRQYTDKFCIRILDLTKMEMADEDTQKDILQWARQKSSVNFTTMGSARKKLQRLPESRRKKFMQLSGGMTVLWCSGFAILYGSLLLMRKQLFKTGRGDAFPRPVKFSKPYFKSIINTITYVFYYYCFR